MKKKFKLYNIEKYHENNFINILNENNIDINDKENIITYKEIKDGKIINLDNDDKNIHIKYKDIKRDNYVEKSLNYEKKDKNTYISSKVYSTSLYYKN